MQVELRNITKRFGQVVANKGVNLTIRSGEVLGLLGENGAGKSTLMNVLCGLYSPTEGDILIDGKPVTFDGPGDAIRAGIGMVHQHFMLVPVFTIAENVVLGVEPVGRLDHLDLTKARSDVRSLSERHRLAVDPDALVETLPVGIQQRVEIIKVLYREADVLILDEPTAVLTPQEVDEFFTIVRSLCEAGKAIVFITHKLNEILEVSDRISVIRRGEIVGEGDPKKLTRPELAEMMVGHPVDFDVSRAPFAPGEVILEVANLTVLRDDGAVAIDDLSITVHSGEVVGIVGSDFWVVDRHETPTVSVSRDTYMSGDAIELSWKNGPGNRNDYLGIYGVGIESTYTPGYDGGLTWLYVDALPEGSIILDKTTSVVVWPLPPGNYVARLMKDDGYDTLAESTPFVVH